MFVKRITLVINKSWFWTPPGYSAPTKTKHSLKESFASDEKGRWHSWFFCIYFFITAFSEWNTKQTTNNSSNHLHPNPTLENLQSTPFKHYEVVQCWPYLRATPFYNLLSLLCISKKWTGVLQVLTGRGEKIGVRIAGRWFHTHKRIETRTL